MDEFTLWFVENRNIVYIGLGVIIYIIFTIFQVRIIRKHFKNRTKNRDEKEKTK